MQVKITRITSANNETAYPGDVVTVSDLEGRRLIKYDAATEHGELKRARKSKQTNEGE
jgi:hypothetical protein